MLTNLDIQQGPHIAGTMAPPQYDASSLPQRVAHWRLLFAVLASVEPQRSELQLVETRASGIHAESYGVVILMYIYVYIYNI